jgi:hypothetical protein
MEPCGIVEESAGSSGVSLSVWPWRQPGFPVRRRSFYQPEAADLSDGFVLSTAGFPPDERDWPGVDPNAVPYERLPSADVLPPGGLG